MSYIPNAINPWGKSVQKLPESPTDTPSSSTTEPSSSTPPESTTLPDSAPTSDSTSASDSAPNPETTPAADTVAVAEANAVAPTSLAGHELSQEQASEVATISEQFTNPLPEIDLEGFQENLLDISEEIGFLHQLGLDFGLGPSSMVQWIIEHIHVYGGMPWWGTLTVAAVLFRIIMFKFTMDSMEASAKLNSLFANPKFKELYSNMNTAMTIGDHAKMMEYKAQVTAMRRMSGASFRPMLLNMINIPLGFGFFRVIRAMCDVPVPSMETGGFGWFVDLTAPDPYHVLPFLSAGGMLALLKSTPSGSPRAAKMQKIMGWVFTPLLLIVSWRLAAGLQWFFVTTGLLSAILNWLRLQPRFRTALGYPAEPPKPVPIDMSSIQSPISPFQLPSRTAAASRYTSTLNSWQPPRALPPRGSGTASEPTVFPGSEKMPKTAPAKAVQDAASAPPRSQKGKGGLLDKMGLRDAVSEVKKTFREATQETDEKVAAKRRAREIEKENEFEERRQREEEDARRARMAAKKKSRR